MKKLKFCILGIILCSMLFVPTMTVNASTLNTYYPHGIEDYVDLNTLTCFDILSDNIFYSTSANEVYKYNKTDKSTTKLTTVNGSTQSINIVGDYVFIFTSSETKVFALDGLTDVSSEIYRPSGYNNATVKYILGKYYYLYTTSNGLSTTLNMAVYKNVRENSDILYTYEFDNSQKYLLDLNENYIIAKTKIGKALYIFNQPTGEESLTPIVNNTTSNNYFNVLEIGESDEIKCAKLLNNNIVVSSDVVMYTSYANNQLTTGEPKNIDIDFLHIKGDKFYVFSKVNCDIIEYTYNQELGKFEVVATIIAGKGDGLGRFKDVNAVTFKAGTLYVTDSGNKRIQIVNKQEILYDTTMDYKCSEIVTDKLNNYYYVLRDTDNSYIYKNGDKVYTINGNLILSIDIDIDGTLYMLSSGRLYTFKNGTVNYIAHFTPVNNSSKLRLSIDYTNIATTLTSLALSSKLFVSTGDTIYELNKKTGVQQPETKVFDDNIVDFSYNYFKYPIVLTADGNLVYGKAVDGEFAKLTGFEDYSCFDIDILSGDIYLYNKKLSAFKVLNDTEFNPAATIGSYYSDLNKATGQVEIWKYGSLSLNTLIYEHPYYLGTYSKIKTTSTNCIILNANEEFAYIAYVDGHAMKTGYIEIGDLANGVQTIGQDGTTFKVRTTNKNVNIYKYPTIYKNTSLSTIGQGMVVTTLGKYPISIDGNDYYIVNNNGQYGYVFAKDVIKNDTISKTINTNATISIFDNSKSVFVYVEADETANVLLTLPDGYKIHAIDYNKNEKFCKINFIDEDGQEREGYVLTKYVKMAGLSPAVVTAIILLVLDAVIAVIVIVFFTVYRKKQRIEAEKDNDNQPEEKTKTKKQNKSNDKESTDNKE